MNMNDHLNDPLEDLKSFFKLRKWCLGSWDVSRILILQKIYLFDIRCLFIFFHENVPQQKNIVSAKQKQKRPSPAIVGKIPHHQPLFAQHLGVGFNQHFTTKGSDWLLPKMAWKKSWGKRVDDYWDVPLESRIDG